MFKKSDSVSCICQCKDLCDQLIHLAERGGSECTDEDCLLFFGLVLDTAYRLKSAGETCLLDQGKRYITMVQGITQQSMGKSGRC